ncbi:hypothetical protein HDU93_001098 [Gonapodya sp. JEL0774]|nr:hypothetical protein HDU93_001098 [Gonapodya sp. JEL0774]
MEIQSRLTVLLSRIANRVDAHVPRVPLSVNVGDVSVTFPPLVGTILLLLVGARILLPILRLIKYFWNILNAPLEYTWHPPENNGKRYNLDEIPTPYPNTWYYFCIGQDLHQGEIKEVHIVGKTLVGTRLKDGRVVVADALFSLENGQLVRIPYADPPDAKLPSFVRLKTYPAVEKTGIVFVWLDAEGREGKDIPFQPFASDMWQGGTNVTDGVGDQPVLLGQKPLLAASGTGKSPGGILRELAPWLFSPRYHGQTTHLIATHILEIPENGADLHHFPALHTQFAFAPLDSFIARIINHNFTAKYNVAPTSHSTYLNVEHQFAIAGVNIGSVMKTRVEQCGPAIAILRINFLGLTEVIIAETPRVNLTCRTIDKKAFVANPPFPKEESTIVA